MYRLKVLKGKDSPHPSKRYLSLGLQKKKDVLSVEIKKEKKLALHYSSTGTRLSGSPLNRQAVPYAKGQGMIS